MGVGAGLVYDVVEKNIDSSSSSKNYDASTWRRRRRRRTKYKKSTI